MAKVESQQRNAALPDEPRIVTRAHSTKHAARDIAPLTAGEAFAVEFAAVHGYCPLDAAGKRIVDEAALRDLTFKADTTALCLSGGGIRSASFCLGVVQALARRNLLSKFDYLSTVSGGGYLGGMIAAWAYRTPGGYADVQRGLREGGRVEGDALDSLRRQARYLAPKQGMLSLDGWTLGATYVRNLLLNALIWLPAIAVVLAVPVLIATLFDGLATLLAGWRWDQVAADVTLGLGVFGIVIGSLELRRTVARDRRLRDAEPGLQQQPLLYAPPTNRDVQRWLFGGVLALTLGGFLLALSADPELFWRSLTHEGRRMWSPALPLPAGTPAPILLGVLLAIVYAALSFSYKPAEQVDNEYRLVAALVGAVSGFVTGVAAGAVLDAAGTLLRDAQPDELTRLANAYITFVPPLLVGCVALGEILFVGGISRYSTDFDREWWSRAGASTAIFAVMWLALFGVSLFGPVFIGKLRDAAFGLPAYWVSIALAGIVARLAMGREVRTGEEGKPTLRALVAERALDIASAIAVVAILVGVAWLVERALPLIASGFASIGVHVSSRAYLSSVLDVITLIAALAAIVALAGLCVNVNRFSLHAMYRDRLTRTFLGATRNDYPAPGWSPDDTDDYRESRQFRARNADQFIKFDRDDNPILRWLAPLRDSRWPETKAPLLVVNATLNLVAGRNLAWQERKSASFTLTPLTVGNPGLGYRPSGDYTGQAGGITLGTAMAISGAAVSPNAGSLSSPVRTFLLTLFNARLGWWLGHPNDHAAVKSMGPRFAVGALIDELLGRTDDRKRWLFVSDGGHFENLGVYEMIRRGCRDLVVVDASCDRERKFDDLGNAIRKVRIDLGVRIERNGPWSIGGRDLQADGRYSALFRVVYPSGSVGSLLYIKSAFYPKAEGLPIDVLQYAERSADFPHESTARQFYGESQFESYGALGEFEIDAMVEGVKTPHRLDPRRVDSVKEFIEIASVQVA